MLAVNISVNHIYILILYVSKATFHIDITTKLQITDNRQFISGGGGDDETAVRDVSTFANVIPVDIFRRPRDVVKI